MHVYLLLRVLVQRLEAMAEVFAACLDIAWTADIVGEEVDNVGSSDLLLEDCRLTISLVFEAREDEAALRSILFRKRMMLVLTNQRELPIADSRSATSLIVRDMCTHR